MELLKIHYNLLSVGYLVLVILCAHLVSTRQYSWRRNSISDLAAQGYSKRWLMRLGFIGFGLIMVGGIVMKIMDKEVLYAIDLPVLLYSLGILFSGIFGSQPLEKDRPYSRSQDLLHHIFEMFAGVALSIALLMSALLEHDMKIKALHIAFLVLITLTSALFGFRQRENAVVQRVLYAICLLWLVGFYNF